MQTPTKYQVAVARKHDIFTREDETDSSTFLEIMIRKS